MEAIQIVSGSTTSAMFAADPDLSLYGDEFQSPELLPGESWSFTFNTDGTYPWFVYPTILTGTVNVSTNVILPSDTFLVTERNPAFPLFGGRVIQVDGWGNVVWNYGSGFIADPKDAVSEPDGTIVIST